MCIIGTYVNDKSIYEIEIVCVYVEPPDFHILNQFRVYVYFLLSGPYELFESGFQKDVFLRYHFLI